MSDEPKFIKLSSIEAYKELRKNYIIDLLKCTGIMLYEIVIITIYWLICLILRKTFPTLSKVIGIFSIKQLIKVISSIKNVVRGIKDVKLVNRSMKKYGASC
jgi:hypothetical protein